MEEFRERGVAGALGNILKRPPGSMGERSERIMATMLIIVILQRSLTLIKYH